MIFIYGKRKIRIKKYDDYHVKCENCDSYEQRFSVFQEYFHIFFIPIFPLGVKTIKSVCLKCNDTFNGEKKKHYLSITRTPLYLYTGVILFIGLIITLVIANITTQKQKAEYVANPKINQCQNIFHILLCFLFVACGQRGEQWDRKFDKYEKQIDKKFSSVETPFPENYDSLCMRETQANITFPRISPSYAVLHFDKFYKSNIRLTLEQMNNIIAILNDTASYRWGELGTPYYDRVITFHDGRGDCIGITKIDFGGETFSIPLNAKMKWGMMKTRELFVLISEIKK